MDIQSGPEKGSRKANNVGGTVSGALYKMAIPSFMKGIEKSTAPYLWELIVKSAMARSAF